MYFVINGTSEEASPRFNYAEFITIFRSYARAWEAAQENITEGTTPEKFRLLELDNDITDGNTTTLHITIDDAREWRSGNISASEYDGRYLETVRPMNESEDELAEEIMEGADNVTIEPVDSNWFGPDATGNLGKSAGGTNHNPQFKPLRDVQSKSVASYSPTG